MSINTPITITADVSMESIERPNGYESVELRSVLDLTQIMVDINSDGDMSEIRCKHCGEELNESAPAETLADGDTECPAADNEQHEQEHVPFTWAKNIAVRFDEENDEIELAIATGDPRGGWTTKLRRTPDGVVLMHLPYEDMASPHEPIKELHPGTFVIG
jgi:hypothetical protein